MFLALILLIITTYVTLNIIEKIIRSQKIENVDKKCVFISGCDSGFGKQLALRLDSLGFLVFAACLTAEGEKSLSKDASSRLTTLSLDVTVSASIQAALEFVKEKLPDDTGVWAVVNNAGVAGPVAMTELSPMNEVQKTMAVNLLGPMEICRKFLPLLRKERGRVVNMASVMGRCACSSPAYNASKFGMEGFSDTLRREVSGQGIRVSILEPGFFLTNILDQQALVASVNKCFEQADQEVRQYYGDGLKKHICDVVGGLQKTANPNTHLVVDAYVHAIGSRYPKTRYVIGWDARIFYIPLSYLPAGLSDWILMKLMQNPRKKL